MVVRAPGRVAAHVGLLVRSRVRRHSAPTPTPYAIIDRHDLDGGTADVIEHVNLDIDLDVDDEHVNFDFDLDIDDHHGAERADHRGRG